MCICSCLVSDVLPIVHDLRWNYYFPVVYVMENGWHCDDQWWMDCGFNFCSINVFYYVGEKYFLRIRKGWPESVRFEPAFCISYAGNREGDALLANVINIEKFIFFANANGNVYEVECGPNFVLNVIRGQNVS